MKLPLILILVGSALPSMAADPQPFAPRSFTLDLEAPKLKIGPMLGDNPFEKRTPASVVASMGVVVPLPVGSVRFEDRPIPTGLRGFLDAPGPGYRAQKEKPLGK